MQCSLPLSIAPLGSPQSTRPLAAEAVVAQKNFGDGNTEVKVLSVMVKDSRSFVRFSVLYPVHKGNKRLADFTR